MRDAIIEGMKGFVGKLLFVMLTDAVACRMKRIGKNEAALAHGLGKVVATERPRHGGEFVSSGLVGCLQVMRKADSPSV